MMPVPLRLATLGLASLLAGCTVLPLPDPPRYMDLARPAGIPSFEQALPVSLRIGTPLASDPLDNNAIVIKPSPYEFQAIPGARWREASPVVVRDYLITAFRASDGFTNVITDTSPASSNVTLVSELAGFHVQSLGESYKLVLSIHLNMMEERSRESLCVRNYVSELPVAAIGLENLVESFSQSADTFAGQAVEWAYECLEAVATRT